MFDANAFTRLKPLAEKHARYRDALLAAQAALSIECRQAVVSIAQSYRELAVQSKPLVSDFETQDFAASLACLDLKAGDIIEAVALDAELYHPTKCFRVEEASGALRSPLWGASQKAPDAENVFIAGTYVRTDGKIMRQRLSLTALDRKLHRYEIRILGSDSTFVPVTKVLDEEPIETFLDGLTAEQLQSWLEPRGVDRNKETLRLAVAAFAPYYLEPGNERYLRYSYQHQVTTQRLPKAPHWERAAVIVDRESEELLRRYADRIENALERTRKRKARAVVKAGAFTAGEDLFTGTGSYWRFRILQVEEFAGTVKLDGDYYNRQGVKVTSTIKLVHTEEQARELRKRSAYIQGRTPTIVI